MATNEEVEDQTEDLEETEASETDAEETDEDDEYTPPTKEEYTRLQNQLKKVNAEAKKHRLAAKSAKDSVEGDDEAVSNARKEVEDKYRPMVLKSALREGLKDAGLLGDPARLLKLADLSDIELDDDGNVNEDDLDEVITSLKGDYPELFKKNRPGSADTGRPATGRDTKPKTASEIQAARALRRS